MNDHDRLLAPVTSAEVLPRLSPEQIEKINLHGPYNHPRWGNGREFVTHEEALQGRGEYLVSMVRYALETNYCKDGLAGKTIADVGCYDGWVLQQLLDLPFADLVGFEPRIKNILKGEAVREAFNLKTRARFTQGGVNDLPQEAFDVVICLGVLHHLSDLNLAVSKLCGACRDLLIIETICLDDSHVTHAMRRESELKDIIYYNSGAELGFSLHKFESSYYDGSAVSTSLVTLPSLQFLRMLLKRFGFGEITILADPQNYGLGIWKGNRPAKAVILSARRIVGPSIEELTQNKITAYEQSMIEILLPEEEVKNLMHEKSRPSPSVSKWINPTAFLTIWNLHAQDRLSPWILKLLRRVCPSQEFEIRRNLRYCPRDKIRFEWAKILRHKGAFEASNQVLHDIIQTFNADWRTVYRSLYLSSLNYHSLKDATAAALCEDKCLICNPEFPLIKQGYSPRS